MTQPPYPSGPPQPGSGPTGYPQASGSQPWPGQSAFAASQPAAQGGYPPPPPGVPPTGSGGNGGPGDNSPKGPKLPGAVIGLIVLAIVVVVGVVGFIAFDSLTSDRPDRAAVAPATSQAQSSDGGDSDGEDGESAQPSGEADRPDDVTSFDSKSGNIHCEIGTNYARCLIDQVGDGFEQPEAPEGCNAANYGRVAVATADKVGYDCSETSMPTGGGKLAYGKSIKKSGMKCTSTEKGMKCYATDGGKGFTIAQAGINWSK